MVKVVILDVDGTLVDTNYLHVEAWARRFRYGEREKVTDAKFTFVAIDENGRPRPLPAQGEA